MKKLGFRTTISLCFGLLALAAPPVGARPPVGFSNSRFITINTPRVSQNDGTVLALGATPYPSAISVSGFGASETIAKITVGLHNLSHANPADIDILLVGPEGQSILLLSDVDGGGVNGGDGEPGPPVTITLDDDAPTPLPDDGPLVSGIFKPTNFEVRGIGDEDEEVDVFPEIVDENGFPIGPAPEPSSAMELSVFAGLHPNGDWLLFVVDDDISNVGSIASGWSLTITTATQSPPFRRGDANADGTLNITDAVTTLAALFQGGSQPACSDAADANDDGALSLTDAIYTLSYLFRGGAAPPTPGPAECGFDPTQDNLSCDSPPICLGECPGIDLLWDSGNCGACGVVCPLGTACAWGVCEGLCINCGG